MKNTKKLFSAGLALAAAAVLATGSTYAWFASNSTVQMSGTKLNVVSAKANLEACLTTVETTDLSTLTYGSSIDATQWTTVLTGGANVKLDALTSTNGITFKDYTNTEYNLGTTYAYAEFRIAFRSTTKMNVFLSDVSKIEAGTSPSGKPAIPYWAENDTTTYGSAVTKGTDVAAKAANATRVAFIADTITGATAATGSTSICWAPNETEENGGATSATDAGNGKGYWKGNLASDYNKYMGVSTTDVTVAQLENTVALLAQNAETGTEDKEVCGMGDETNSYYYASVVVRIWIEGTDGDCFNSIYSDEMNITLGFTAIDVI